MIEEHQTDLGFAEKSIPKACRPRNHKSRKVDQPRKVHFNETVKCYKHMALNHFSRQEHEAIWYTEKEMSRIKRERSKVLNRIESGKDPKEDMSYRGLECMTKVGIRALEDNVVEAVNAVMDEQERQWATDYDSAGLIAVKSRHATASCGLSAYHRGKADEQEACAIFLPWINFVCKSDVSSERCMKRQKLLVGRIQSFKEERISPSAHVDTWLYNTINERN